MLRQEGVEGGGSAYIALHNRRATRGQANNLEEDVMFEVSSSLLREIPATTPKSGVFSETNNELAATRQSEIGSGS